MDKYLKRNKNSALPLYLSSPFLQRYSTGIDFLISPDSPLMTAPAEKLPSHHLLTIPNAHSMPFPNKGHHCKATRAVASLHHREHLDIGGGRHSDCQWARNPRRTMGAPHHHHNRCQWR
ncbi:hypothetical protein CEXT_351521 [Caerostris extrusa]|uniref:Uncharacterized protein n=1 Tax=Caerostris extrusa TaxID=172846 RepID=A0AAV4XPS4_CAEEX|nr:hypothetical protein CEXT_351521 [Caerostris extrusa]